MNSVTFQSTGPLLVVGGPYSNLEATQAFAAEAARLRIPPRQIVCTGDVVAYAADPQATVDLVRAAGWQVVMGNCEESLAGGAADCGCGFPEGSACERLSSAWFGFAAAQLNREALNWMRGLPRRIDIKIAGLRLAVVHGGLERINQYIFASTDPTIKAQQLAASGADGIVAGHCGLPFTQTIGGRLWHNAGVIGMPANDGTPRVWFSVLHPEEQGLRIEHRLLDYDFRTAAAKMRRAGLPHGYADALDIGLWPNCDVLLPREIEARGRPLEEASIIWPRPSAFVESRVEQPAADLWPAVRGPATRPDPRRFKDAERTADGQARATVALKRLRTLWFNTGTVCNITCRNCYIESSPSNDRLAFLTRDEVSVYLDEIERGAWGTEEIGLTGGEPFANPHFIGVLEETLSRGFETLVLTNAMRPMRRHRKNLLDLLEQFGKALKVRVSLDHFTPERHEDERGAGTFDATLDGLRWLAQSGFKIAVAGRTMWSESPASGRRGYAALFEANGIRLNAEDPSDLVLFPEMNPNADVPEITESCWGILGKSPEEVMCSSSRMVLKRKGSDRPSVVACTLVPYDLRFELGTSLIEAARPVPLNHPFCASFCVLGGGSCSTAAGASG